MVDQLHAVRQLQGMKAGRASFLAHPPIKG